MIRFCTFLSAFIFISIVPTRASDNAQSIYINCPSDRWVYCDDFDHNLSSYGRPQVTSAYAYDIEELDSEYHLGSCDIGHIIRNWKIIDHHDYKSYYCQQEIKIKSHGTSISIDWPDDYVIYECNPDLDPHSLPDRYGYPKVHESGGCSDNYIGYKDFNLYNDGSVCYKVLREWTVIDWCQYEPNSGSYAGKWVYEQFIKIRSEDIPDIYCPDDITVTVDEDCYGAYVQLEDATGKGKCESEVNITNDSPYANNNGANASGNYPLGITWVKFTIDDHCGNKATCKIKITVKDMTGPTVFCKYGISVPLATMHDGYYTNLWATEFNQKSYDNCTDEKDLIFEISLNQVTCDHLGQNDVDLTVTDEQGNSTTCRSFVIVQDNRNICPDTTELYSVDGLIMSENSHPIENVRVAINGDISDEIMSDINGYYNYSGLDFAFDYQIKPIRNENITEGLSFFDLIQLIWHIVGKSEIDNPQSLVAADIDNSGSIDIYDFHSLRNVIYGLTDNFPNNTSWRFNLESNDLSNVDDPLTDLTESYLIESMNENMKDLNFEGIKIGDIDRSLFARKNIYSRSNKVEVMVSSREFTSEEFINIPLIISEQNNQAGLIQIDLNYDPSVLQYIELKNNFDPTFYFLDDAEVQEGKLRISAYGTLSDVEVIFKSKKRGSIENALSYGSFGQKITDNGYLYELELTLNQYTMNETQLTVSPNPFNNTFEIEFTSDKESTSTFILYNTQGQEIITKDYNINKGVNVYQIDATDIRVTGPLMYKLINDQSIMSGQVIKIE